MPRGPEPLTLRLAQETFLALIAAPEGVARGAEAMAREGKLESADLGFLLHGDDGLGAVARLDIYADMYFYRLLDCLRQDFPKTAAVAGGARFHNLVTDYLLEHPSCYWSLRDVGARLPGFLAGHPLAREYPFLADLAGLEWARADVFDETDARPLSRRSIAGLDPSRLETLRLGLIPACRLLSLEWSVAPVWLAIEQGEAVRDGTEVNSAAPACCAHEPEPPAAIDPPGRAAARLRVWRRGFTVYHRSIPPDEAACLSALADGGGLTLPDLCEVLLAAGEAGEQPPLRMAGLLGIWIEDEMIVQAG
ncbi:MAG TPA: DNA-binding domain-containing protein [Candidatus Polarisedimenticolia bacterium]|nr:DNA-binding domain-containing protein [Candidatus Polarisedimenticolia bacterium]